MTTGRDEKTWTETTSHKRAKKTKFTDNTTSIIRAFFISLVSLCRQISQGGSQQCERCEWCVMVNCFGDYGCSGWLGGTRGACGWRC